jgi:hypothetical protein
LNELVMQMTMKETEDGTSLMILALPSEEVKYLGAIVAKGKTSALFY